MDTFSQYKAKTSSEKLVLAWLEPSQRLFTWTVHAGSVYKKVVDYYVVGVRQDATALTSVASIAAISSAGKWFFDADTKTLYVQSTGSVDPGTLWTDVTYRLFFSNAPIDLPADLNTAKEVPYDARLMKTSKFKDKFDKDQKGIALEGTGTVSLHNNDSFFEQIYDKLIWENKTAKVFSYHRDLPLSEKVTLFNGVITNKDFDDEEVSFDIKNFIYRLRTDLDLGLYSASDGDLADSLIGRPKRRIYGRVDGLLCDSVSNMQGNYELQTIGIDDARTGTPITVSLTQGSNIATASSTDIHKELVAGDTIIVSENKLKVKSLSRIDIGLDTAQDVTVSRTSAFVARIAFSAISTSGVTIGDHITLAVLSNASQDTKSKIIGHFPIAVVNAAYLEFTLSVSIASLADVFKTGVGEIAVTRQSNTTTFTIQQVSPITVAGEGVTVQTTKPYRRFNRDFLLADHALSTKETTITSVISSVKFALDSVDSLYVGDSIRINGDELSTVVGLNREGGIITVADVVLPLPMIGDVVERLGVQRVTFEQLDYEQFVDFSPTFSVAGAGLTFEYDAEFNATVEEAFQSNAQWRLGSKQVLGSNNVFRDVKPRDWVRSQTEGTWYEVSEKFSDNLVIVNTPYTGTTGENATSFKFPNYIGDTSKIIAEVYGKTDDGTEGGVLLSTAAEVVEDLLTEAGVSESLDAASFTQAAEDAPYLISLALPYIKGSKAPKIRDVITRINDSVIGSLYNNIGSEIKYKVLDASRTLDDATLLDDGDVLSYTVQTDSTDILRKVIIRYADRDADTTTEQPTYSVVQAESEFVANSGIEGQVETVQTVLYAEADAEIIAQRISFIRELASSTVSISVKLQLADAVLNDLVTVDLARLYARLGTSGTDTTKTGLINSIEKDGLSVRATIDDLGNLFNRVAVITANDADEYADASESERRYAGYITDDVGLVDDEEDTFNANLIG